jgi:hypothetical protein
MPKQPTKEPVPSIPIKEILAKCTRWRKGIGGQILWLNKRCKEAEYNEITEPWLEIIEGFFASNKPICLLLAGLRAAKTTTLLRVVALVALLTDHKLESGSVALVPIMSATPELASQVLGDIEKLLWAMGITPSQDDGAEVIPNGLGGEYHRSLNSGGGGKIDVVSPFGYKVRFLCNSITVRHNVGSNVICGFADEFDCWPQGEAYQNSATEIGNALCQRITTTRKTAKLFFSSAWYPGIEQRRGTRSAHRVMLERGDTLDVHIARLGRRGSAIDVEARLAFAKAHNLSDPRLLEPANPNSNSIPSWSTNPRVTIDACHVGSNRDLDRMFAEYGGRYDSKLTKGSALWTPEQYQGLVDMNRRLNPKSSHVETLGGENSRGGLIRFPNLPADDPRSNRNQRGRGPVFL